MSVAGRWVPTYTLFQKEVRRFLKVMGQTIWTPFVTSFLYLLIFGVSLGKSIQLSSGVSYLVFLVPGLIMMSVLNNCFQNTSSSIIAGKFAGDLEDLKMAPISHLDILLAMGAGALVRGFLVGLITFFVGAGFIYHMEGELLGAKASLWLLYFLVFGGLSFAFMGISVAFWARTFDQASAFGAFLLLPLTYLGGVFFSIENLHPIWQSVARLNPLLYLINGVRYGLLGMSDVDVVLAAGVTLISCLFFLGMAYRSLVKGTFQRW